MIGPAQAEREIGLSAGKHLIERPLKQPAAVPNVPGEAPQPTGAFNKEEWLARRRRG